MKITKEVVADLFVAVYEKQAEKYGGETTLNELRVIASCYQAFTYGHGTSITTLSESLDIPPTTVHRSVSNLMDKGWIVDEPDPEDGRKRIIRLSDQGVSGGLWKAVEAFVRTHPANSE